MTTASNPPSAESTGGVPASLVDSECCPSGFAARQFATSLVQAVLVNGRGLDDAIAHAVEREARLAARDRAFARLIAATVLRRCGQLEKTLGAFIERPLPAERGRL